MVSTESTESLTDMINLLLGGSDGGDSPESFLAVHPSVSVSYKVVLSTPGRDNLTYAPVRVDTTREGVGEEVERDAGENFLSSVSFDITVAIFFRPSYLDGRIFVTPLKEFFADPGRVLATVSL
jgi:hypothetical protein